TSVLFVQKWNDDESKGPLCPKVDDYNIFFATMQKPGKDNSGEKIFVKQNISEEDLEALEVGDPTVQELDQNSSNKYLLDNHGHLIVDHDLFNHEGLTEDGIAEAFIEFAKKEKLSFF